MVFTCVHTVWPISVVLWKRHFIPKAPKHNVHTITLHVYYTCTSFAEEEKKRKQESSFSAVGFSYGSVAPPSAPPQRKEEEEAEDPPMLACYPQQLEHPPSSSVDHRGDGEEEYVPPPGLIIPNNIKPVCNVCFFLRHFTMSDGHLGTSHVHIASCCFWLC